MEIKLKNGSAIISVDTPGKSIRSKPKSFEQMKWILGDIYKNLHWYQKLYLWTLYCMPDTFPMVLCGRKYYK